MVDRRQRRPPPGLVRQLPASAARLGPAARPRGQRRAARSARSRRISSDVGATSSIAVRGDGSGAAAQARPRAPGPRPSGSTRHTPRLLASADRECRAGLRGSGSRRRRRSRSRARRARATASSRHRAAVRVAVVVNAEDPGHDPEPRREPRLARRSGCTPHSNQHIAPALWPASTTPRSQHVAQDRVDPVGAPDREQVDHAAAADVDQVLGEQVARRRRPARSRAGTARRARRAQASPARLRRKAAICSAASPPAVGSRQIRGSRPAGEGEHVVADRLVAAPAGELVAAEREDRAPVRRHRARSAAVHLGLGQRAHGRARAARGGGRREIGSPAGW